jgi:putative DNA methylase
MSKKKLIEVALPLETINRECAREKQIRHGHPCTLHIWWARRPLACARAVIWASLVDDPSSHPDAFPTEEAQTKERERLIDILKRLIVWENSNNQEILDEAKAEIMKSTNNNPPAFLDPFAGGGAIPLEAQRLGLEAHAGDLNPIAVMLNKAMIEMPPKFANQPPINPKADKQKDWEGMTGMVDDLRYYSDWIKDEAYKQIGHLYPTVKDEHGTERTVVAWIWTKTIECPNPACRCRMPLASTFVLYDKPGKEAYVQPIIDGNRIRYEVRHGTDIPDPPKLRRGVNFKCLCCGHSPTPKYVRDEFAAKRGGAQLMAIVAEGSRGRVYLSPTEEHEQIAKICDMPDWKPAQEINPKAVSVGPRNYGAEQWIDLFTTRQLRTLTTVTELIMQVRRNIEMDGGSDEYVEGMSIYLACILGRLADIGSNACTWRISAAVIQHVFCRQSVQMVWDFAEGNPFSNSTGSYNNMVKWITNVLLRLPAGIPAHAVQRDAQAHTGMKNVMVSTDPPYYDNINYADLSDFFYIWIRPILEEYYREMFWPDFVPKLEELIVAPHRFDGDRNNASQFFEDGMTKTFQRIYDYTCDDVPMTVYYGYSRTETDKDGNISSVGWETFLTGLIQSGFIITAAWPIRTEMKNRTIAANKKALSTSIIFVCRKRHKDAPVCTRRDFVQILKSEMYNALDSFHASHISDLDTYQSAIGPGMMVYSRFAKVMESDGTAMTVKSALKLINVTLIAWRRARLR